MSQLFLSDSENRENLYPFTQVRSAADIRIGILTIREKWKSYLGEPVQVISDVSAVVDAASILSSSIIPSPAFVESLFVNGEMADRPDWDAVKILQYPWHIFQWNDWALRQDFDLITRERQSQPLPSHVQAINPSLIFIEPGARLSPCVLNAEEGPVYIGKNSIIMDGAMIRGPFAICEGAVVKMGARIYGATTIGPYATAGGEIKNSVIFGFSNKAHDGYLGDSVIGEWCNLGAGTSNSNVKNNASEVRVYSIHHRDYLPTGLFKCGLFLGDYSRTAINTSFNTGTVVGICANVFGEGSTSKYVPAFSWGNKGTEKYGFEKAIEDIGKWKNLKGHSLAEDEKKILRLIFDQNE